MPLTAEQRIDYDANRQLKRTGQSGCVYEAFRDAFDHGPADWERRRKAVESFGFFCETYGKGTFRLRWSAAHIRAIDKIERVIRDGDLFAFAMARGGGKSALCRWGVKWGIANGHTPYAVLIGATDAAARKELKKIREVLRYNDLLFDDYPELCAPIRHLRGEPRKAASQNFRGTPTGIAWGMDQIILAHIPLDYAVCSESVIDVAGITGDIRGRSYMRRDGTLVRPTVGICDDPQTRGSARSKPDTNARLDTIKGDVAYLAGPDRPVGVIVPCTVIVAGDLADQLLDREQNPEFHGERTAFFESLPSDAAMAHWEGEYARLLRKALRDDVAPTEATAYYAAKRAAMDEGAVASWPDRYFAEKGELSAVQRGMNEYLRDRRAFLAEYQNEPEESAELPSVPMLDEKALAAKVSGREKGVAVAGAAYVVAMIDVHETLLYYTAAAVQSDFTGGPIAKGVYPEQPTRDFTLRSARVTLQDRHTSGAENAIVEGLVALFWRLIREPWQTPDKSALPLSMILVDTGYKPELVARAILSMPAEVRSIIRGSRGMGFGPDAKPMTEYDTSPQKMRRAGPDRRAPRWYVPADARHGIEVVCFDTDYWKAALHARFCTQPGQPGEWSLWGDRDEDHREFVRHLLSQRPREKAGKVTGRTVNVFELQNGFEDHWLDSTVGCLVAASVLGCQLPGQAVVPRKVILKKAKPSASVSYV